MSSRSKGQSPHAAILERRIKARAAAMGMTLLDVAKNGGCTYQSLHAWLSSGVLTPLAKDVLKKSLGVTDMWLESVAYGDICDGLDAIYSNAVIL